MKKLIPLILLLAALTLMSMKGDKPAYQVYNAKGRQVTYDDISEAAAKADIIFFGELHNNPICHWLEFELTRDLERAKGAAQIAVGMEMFEADNQLIINEYLGKMIRKKDFESEAKLWPNYKTDYAPVLDYARDKGIQVIATNIPRRYAALVNQKGFEGLDSINAMQRGLMAPLPVKYPDTLPCYANIAEVAGEGLPEHMKSNLGKAQAIKDATMAHFLMKHGALNGKAVFHINGSYHSDNHEGIVWYVKQGIRKTSYDLKVLTITCLEQENIDTLSKKDASLADFIIVIPESMTKGR